MPTTIIQEFSQRMERRGLEILAEFTQRIDSALLEATLNQKCAKRSA